MTWRVTFFNGRVERETLAFPPGILANLLHIMEMMESMGPNLGKPYTDSMGEGLFEIRAKGKEGIGRSMFCIVVDQEIVIVHSFIKKSRKTPRKELAKARKRQKELQ